MSTIRKSSSTAHKERYETKHNNGGKMATKREAERRPSTRQDSFKKSHREESHIPSTSRTPRDGSQHKRTGNESLNRLRI
uniref:TRAF3 n=1 Tax=Phlebotomus perniciosus TaxID=13204 RepID=A0A5B8HDJ9_PHLPE|nr:TRAM1 [Phlebotomus perniciosus]QDX01811.1 TRAF3 [Phlebotomus perniciosus]